MASESDLIKLLLAKLDKIKARNEALQEALAR
jgi:hypothetical protein